MIEIDGSQGEGGGQVLRTALALSLVTGKPFRIDNIRAKRRKPGLMRQHLTAVEAATRVGSARVEGAAVGSTHLVFEPAGVVSGEHSFSIGTAGSATLVLQTVLPALLTADGPSTLVVEGGTHNPLAPPFDFLAKAFLPLVNRMGPRVEAVLERPGFFPAGGGRIRVQIAPVPALQPLHLLERGEILSRTARALMAHLPRSIGERELHVVAARLNWEPAALRVEEVQGSRGPGNVLVVEVACEHVTEVFTGFGERGVSAEKVAEDACAEARRWLGAQVPVGEHLADQLMIPLAMAGGGSFRTLPLSGHARTQSAVVRMFLGVNFDAQLERPGVWRVDVSRRT